MVDIHEKVVETISRIGLPVHYELFLHSGLETPCISYMEITNFVETQTDVTDISTVIYQVKVWDNSIKNVQKYALLLDAAMRKAGFQRVSAQELHDTNSTMIEKVFTYQVKTAEEFIL